MSHYAPLIAALVTLLLTFILSVSKAGASADANPQSNPAEHKPVPPYIGGVGLFAGILSGWAIMVQSLTWWIVLPTIGIFALALYAEIQSLQAQRRVALSIVLGAIIVIGSGSLSNIVASAIFLFAVIVMPRTFQVIGQSQGLLSGYSFIGFTLFGITALMNHHEIFAMLNFTIGSAALAFLYHNFPPGKILMGNPGAAALGTLSMGMGLQGWLSGDWPAWFPFLIFLPVIGDVIFSCATTGWQFNQMSFLQSQHQHAINSGKSEHILLFMQFALMIATGVSAIVCLLDPASVVFFLFVGWISIYSSLYFWLRSRTPA